MQQLVQSLDPETQLLLGTYFIRTFTGASLEELKFADGREYFPEMFIEFLGSCHRFPTTPHLIELIATSIKNNQHKIGPSVKALYRLQDNPNPNKVELFLKFLMGLGSINLIGKNLFILHIIAQALTHILSILKNAKPNQPVILGVRREATVGSEIWALAQLLNSDTIRTEVFVQITGSSFSKEQLHAFLDFKAHIPMTLPTWCQTFLDRGDFQHIALACQKHPEDTETLAIYLLKIFEYVGKLEKEFLGEETAENSISNSL